PNELCRYNFDGDPLVGGDGWRAYDCGVLLAAPLVAAPDAMPGLTIPGDPTMGHPDDMAPMPGMAIQN
ncbi:MAG TPA: hypothetical protein VN888_12950, partial [Mycobacterium sp.]|nr:hypothetical protein [Mycobacterium sp.]